jgi:hypothetical protein
MLLSMYFRLGVFAQVTRNCINMSHSSRRHVDDMKCERLVICQKPVHTCTPRFDCLKSLAKTCADGFAHSSAKDFVHAIQLYAIHIGKYVVRIGKPWGHPYKYACRP